MAGIIHEVETHRPAGCGGEAADAAAAGGEQPSCNKGPHYGGGLQHQRGGGASGGRLVHAPDRTAIFDGLNSVFAPWASTSPPVLRAPEPCAIVEMRAVPGARNRRCAAPAQGGQFLRHRRLPELPASGGAGGIGPTPVWISAAPSAGMHLKKVAVPVRLPQNHIGSAILLAARVRPKFIGGERAIYDEHTIIAACPPLMRLIQPASTSRQPVSSKPLTTTNRPM